METINLTCIGCPMGCPLTVTMENGEVKDVTGNTCKRGDDYARKEVTNPTRIVTSTAKAVKLMLYLLKQNQIFQKAKSLMYVVH